jgi:hypothetical protein
MNMNSIDHLGNLYILVRTQTFVRMVEVAGCDDIMRDALPA